MVNLDKNSSENGAELINRVIWVDPNLSNNRMVNTEDLSIKVEFSTQRKKRSVLFSGQALNNTGGDEAKVTFIEGSRVSDSKQPSLTTRYTDAIELEVINDNNQKNDDFESLGIESIDIEFNTSFQPIIKIKFIDVRGQAILEQGANSKYRMFFELPYPIYNLKIKGFYGKTVSYCLHMQRWNASFNSNTGNFEIQADFLGYTYAVLTDMLLGLIRASVRTERGQEILKNKKDDYGQNSDLVLTIDEMLKRLIELNFSVKKISSETGDAAELQTYDGVFEIINSMNITLDELINSIESQYFTDNNYYVCAPIISEEKFKKTLEEYNIKIDKLVDEINLKLDGYLKFDKSALKKIVKVNNISKSDLTSNTIIDKIKNNSYFYPTQNKRYSSDDDSTSDIDNMLKVIGGLGSSTLSDNTKFDIYNFKFIKFYINVIKKNELEKQQKKTETNLTQDLRDLAITTLGFEPTIRNIFRILSINTEIFLEVLRGVSLEAEENTNRKNEFGKLVNPSTSSFNIQTNDLNNLNIYPWPEYRAKNNSNPNDGFVESWLGSALGIDSSKINEVVFTNEIHQKLLDVARFDDELDSLIDNLDAGLDIDKSPILVENPWFPVGVADTPIDPRMTQNPYLTAIEEETNVDSIQRLLLMRTFLLLGVSTLNGKIDDPTLEFMGRAEAENLFFACRKFGQVGQDLINLYLNNGGDIKTYTDRVIGNFGINGSDKIKNPLNEKKRPIMERVQENGGKLSTAPSNLSSFYYKYTYIINENTKSAYIPVNKGFSGFDFYNSNSFKNITQLKELSNNILFVSNPINWKNSNGEGSRFWKQDDGSLHTKIYELSEYESKGMIPQSEVYDEVINSVEQSKLNDPTKIVLDVNTLTAAIINENTNGLESGLLTTLNNPNSILKGFVPYNNQYTSPEFKELNYDSDGGEFGRLIGEPKWDNSIKFDSSILAFYTENTERFSDRSSVFYPYYGTYLSKVIKSDDLSKVIKTTTPSQTQTTIEYLSVLTNAKVNSKLESIKKLKSSDSGYIIDPRKIWIDKGSYLKNKKLLSYHKKEGTNIYLPFIEYGAYKDWSTGDNKTYYNISLFGSYFYYSQETNYAKALLFLHSIPWQGVKTFADDIDEFLMFDKRLDWGHIEVNTSDGSIKQTRVKSIKTLFQVHGGFIHAPKAWVLFIGAMLWRIREQSSSGKSPIFYSENRELTLIDPKRVPYKEEFLYYTSESTFGKDSEPDKQPWGMFFINEFNNKLKKDVINDSYVRIDKTIRYLPKQVRDEFINYFINWVDATDGFKSIQKSLEIVKDKSELTIAYNKLNTPGIIQSFNQNLDGYNLNYKRLRFDLLYNVIDKSIVDNYELVAPSTISSNFSTILKPNTDVMNSIVSLLVTPTIIQNANPNIWNYNPYNEYSSDYINNDLGRRFGYEGLIPGTRTVSPSKTIRVRADKMREFINAFHAQLIAKKEDFLKENVLTDDDITNIEIFGTSDDKTIKLQIYRTLSSINDKWVNGSSDSNIFSQCGTVSNEKHLEHSKKYRINSDNTTSLIDTFRFIDRAFRDIGDKFFIDINKVTNLIKGEYNKSFFDVSNQILTDNNFNFIPLPNFINFNDKDELESIFKPYSYNDIVTFNGTGPSFICCFVGQTSTNLDLGLNSTYPDDGFSINRGENLPDDFEGAPDIKNGDMYVPVFSVNYGQQNQNYFKNIKLDQREFAETMESLEIIEALSQTGDKSKVTFAGNNLFNVYQTRSYSAEVEMLGSAMIQPMMYFQLNNIPMFRGAYLIYKVNHKITPHNMVTTFKGNRVKRTKTPLLDEATLYMNLVGAQSSGRIGSSRSGTLGGFVSKYYSDLIANIPNNKTIEGSTLPNKSALTKRAEEEIKKWKSGALNEKDGVDYLNIYAETTPGPSGSEYSSNAQPWSAVFISYIMVAGDPDFPKSPLHYNYITAAINGKKGYELFGLNSGLKIKAEIGDLLCAKRSGGYTASHCDVVYKVNNNIAYIVGGNLSDSIGLKEITLDGGYFTDSSKVGEYKLYVKKTGNKYYNNKKIIGTGDYYEAGGDGSETPQNTVLTNQQQKKNQLTTKNFLKGKGLTKEQTAAIMGNIHKETGGTFNPLALNKADLNGYPSVGLIQWNGKSNKFGPSKDENKILDIIGRTVETQLTFLIDKWSTYKTWSKIQIRDNKTGESNVWYLGYEFAKIVEVCANCTKGLETYKNDKKFNVSQRSKLAESYFQRFNTSGDELSW